MYSLWKFVELYRRCLEETATMTPYKKDHRIQVKYSKSSCVHLPHFPLKTHGYQSYLLLFLHLLCFMFILPIGEELCTVQTPGPILPRHPLQRKERSECNLGNSSSPRRCQPNQTGKPLPLRKSSSFRWPRHLGQQPSVRTCWSGTGLLHLRLQEHFLCVPRIHLCSEYHTSWRNHHPRWSWPHLEEDQRHLSHRWNWRFLHA